MLYLWLPTEMFIYINSQVLYVIFLFNTSDINLFSRTNQTWLPCGVLAQIKKLPLRTYTKTRLYYNTNIIQG